MGLLALEIILFYAYIVPHVEMTVNAAIMDGLQRAIIKWPNATVATVTTSTTDYVAPYAAYLIDQRAMSIALEDSLLMMRIQAQGTVTSIAILAWILCAVTWCFMAMDEVVAHAPACMQLPSSPTSFSLRSDSGVDEVIPQEETLSSLNEVVATFSRHGRLPHDGEEATAFSRHRYTM
jgi:hypothetical protein